MSTFVLWDIDGTLIQNTPSAGTLYLEAIEHVTGVRPSVPVENPHGMTEGQLLVAIMDANGLDSGRLGEVLFDLDVISREQYERGQVRELCVGVESALTAVAERGWTNALLTGNGPNRARFKLLAAGLDPEVFDWDHSYFGHESPTRHHLTAGARDALGGHRALIVGDTPNDGLAADSAGIPFVAVATGVYAHEQLAATNAVAVIDDLASGIDELLGAIEAAVGDAPESVEAVAAAGAADAEITDAEITDTEITDTEITDAEITDAGLADAGGTGVSVTESPEAADPADEASGEPEPPSDAASESHLEAESSIAPGPSTEPPITPQPTPEPSFVPPSEPSIVPEPEPAIEPAPEPGPLVEPSPERGPLIEPPSVPGAPAAPSPEPSVEPEPESEAGPSAAAEPEPLVEPEPLFEPRSAHSVAPTVGRVDRDESSDTGELHLV